MLITPASSSSELIRVSHSINVLCPWGTRCKNLMAITSNFIPAVLLESNNLKKYSARFAWVRASLGLTLKKLPAATNLEGRPSIRNTSSSSASCGVSLFVTRTAHALSEPERLIASGRSLFFLFPPLLGQRLPQIAPSIPQLSVILAIGVSVLLLAS